MMRRMTYIAAFMAFCGSGEARTPAGAANNACVLLTPSELESATGLKVPAFKDVGMRDALGAGANEASICMATAPQATVMLRMVKTKGATGNEARGIEIAKKMGAQVEVKTFGAVTCSMTLPPASMAQYGFNTTCSLTKQDTVAAIEVTAKTQKDMVSIEKLRPLAEKMAARI